MIKRWTKIATRTGPWMPCQGDEGSFSLHSSREHRHCWQSGMPRENPAPLPSFRDPLLEQGVQEQTGSHVRQGGTEAS